MKKSEKTRRIKPELPSGFREYGFAQAIAKQGILDVVRKTFESFGFDPIETPAVERTEVLTGGEEDAEKIIYNVRPSTSSGRKGRMSESLRFDLTVPLARFVAANPETPKPFKRYQIGQVWRGESPQAGRYREFTQADIDIVGSSSVEADAEVIAVIYQTLENLGLNNFVIKINDRKIFSTLPQYAGFPEKKLWEVLRVIDKKDKIGANGMKKELEGVADKKAVEKINEFLARPLELKEIQAALRTAGVPQKNYEFDISLVRGLGYYTGTIFEAVLTNAPEIGSVFSGGRYDNLLVPLTGQKIPAVGASLGVDRLMAALEKIGKLKTRQTKTQVLILNLAPELQSEYNKMARDLRDIGINTALYLGDDRAFQAQLAYAVKKEIPYIVIYGEEEKKKGVVAVKNMQTREQKEIPKEKLAKTIEVEPQ